MAEGRTHRPSHDNAKCRACGVCIGRCPAQVFDELRDETDSLRGAVYRVFRFDSVQLEHPPCRLACPLQQDVPAYLAAVARGDVSEAGSIVRATNALPSVCGRVCIASCMRACTRASLDEGVDIRAIKRFAVAVSREGVHEQGADCGVSLGIVGAGPAGLAAAHRARQLGARAVVYEARQKPGGLLVEAVAPMVLAEASVAQDIAALVDQGVEIRTGVRLGENLPWTQLESQHDAVIVATGAGRALNPSREGSRLATDLFEFCRRDGLEERRVEGPVVIEGGGHAAIQAARIALRQGASGVTVVHSHALEQWPCGHAAIAAARAEGVHLLEATRVHSLNGGNRLESVAVQPVKERGRDAVGRAKLMTVGKVQELAARVFVSTVDRRPLPENLPDVTMCARGPLGSLLGDARGRLTRSKWYAAGEAMTSAATVVDSMATGRRAAQSAIEDVLAAKAGAR